MSSIPEVAMVTANDDLDAPDRRTRQEAAVALRIAGANYSEIATTLGYMSSAKAREAVERALAASIDSDDRERLRTLEGKRLERLLRGLWRKATDDANPEHLSAVRTAVAVIDRHARLFGLDAPQQMVVYTPAGEEIAGWVAQMASQVRGELPAEHDIIEGQIAADTTGDDG
jgi:hypothetical protein